MAPALILCVIGAPSFALLQGADELNQPEVTLWVIEGETALEGGETTPTSPSGLGGLLSPLRALPVEA
jgi:hypothetical protein